MYDPDIHSVRSGNMFTLTLATPAPEKEGGGSMDYHDLINKPTLNGVPIDGDLTTEDLGILNKPFSADDIDAIIDAVDRE